MQIKEINLYSIGDSSKAKTWSNVPYFFSRQLEVQGLKINRINIEENRILSKIYRYSFYPFLKLLYPKSQHNYFRSRINNLLTSRIIKKAISDFPQAQLQLFMSFSFSSKNYSKSPCVLFGDWTYLYLIEKLQHRKAYWFEKKALERETQNINTVDLVISLFPISNHYISKYYQPKQHIYLSNVVNSELEMGTQDLLHLKLNSQLILFIGNRKYLSAAKQLLEVFHALNKETFPATELHFIGLNDKDLGKSEPKVVMHGYLDKTIPSEKKRYYDLLCKARVVVNSQKHWGAFSALTEAMYYGTPVICTPFEEFTETYGQNNSFGSYLNESSNTELLTKLQEILAMKPEEYSSLVLNAREKTKNFTWEKFSRAFLEIASKLTGQGS